MKATLSQLIDKANGVLTQIKEIGALECRGIDDFHKVEKLYKLGKRLSKAIALEKRSKIEARLKEAHTEWGLDGGVTKAMLSKIYHNGCDVISDSMFCTERRCWKELETICRFNIRYQAWLDRFNDFNANWAEARSMHEMFIKSQQSIKASILKKRISD